MPKSNSKVDTAGGEDDKLSDFIPDSMDISRQVSERPNTAVSDAGDGGESEADEEEEQIISDSEEEQAKVPLSPPKSKANARREKAARNERRRASRAPNSIQSALHGQGQDVCSSNSNVHLRVDDASGDAQPPTRCLLQHDLDGRYLPATPTTRSKPPALCQRSRLRLTWSGILEATPAHCV